MIGTEGGRMNSPLELKWGAAIGGFMNLYDNCGGGVAIWCDGCNLGIMA